MIDVTPELRRRIKIAAAKRDLSVRDYVVAILERAVPAGERLGVEQGRTVTAEMIERLEQIQSTLMQGRTFSDDSTELINQAREERTAEL
ncbi:MAG: hypothetical protein HY335_03895 [Deinococcus sp.]|nr:hypothetical protein [Deinococcus sp.]